MKNRFVHLMSAVLIFLAWNTKSTDVAGDSILLKNATVIDGNGGTPVKMDVWIQGGKIAGMGKDLAVQGADIKDLTGKTIIPALISAHVHVGTLKDTTTKPENYTRENILHQLNRYQEYGVVNILVMGTDRPMLFNGMRDSSEKGKLPGARIHSAGYGFGVPAAAPPIAFAMDEVFRPNSAAEVPAMVDALAKLNPTVIKMWVDDFGGKFKKMDEEVYKTIISEAHKHNIRVASHVYYLEDARKLIGYGLDIIAHSIRDKDIDDNLLQLMKAKKTVYIPTLSLDEYAYIYAQKPEWIDNTFFRASLEKGVYEMITSRSYQDRIKNSPDYEKNAAAFATALRNVKKVYDAGIIVALGTDSGAQPIRAQGFSEHLELELMVQAGLTPLQVITVATKNAANTLEIGNQYGTIEKGKVADIIILGGDPLIDIKNTRKIEAVYKAGKEVSHGPLKD